MQNILKHLNERKSELEKLVESTEGFNIDPIYVEEALREVNVAINTLKNEIIYTDFMFELPPHYYDYKGEAKYADGLLIHIKNDDPRLKGFTNQIHDVKNMFDFKWKI